MKKICQFYKQLFPNSRQAVIAALIGLSISLTIYLGLLQRHFFSWIPPGWMVEQTVYLSPVF
jgi:hypothetical protein